MTPGQFLAQLESKGPAPAYLFLGAEAYQRNLCRRALLERVLSQEERESALTRHELGEVTLAEVVDDARSLSLFSPRRVIWASSAEAVLPKGHSKSDEDASGAALLAGYVRDPSPGVVLVLESSRYELSGEGNKKADRVRKFYSSIPERVEFPPYRPNEAQTLARQLAAAAGLRVGGREIALLVEAVGGDAARIAVEIEKLRLYAGEGGAVTEEEIADLVPSARAATIFALVDALAAGDRRGALNTLDTLVRAGEYLPLALTFLDSQFRYALVAKEARLRSPQQIQGHFSKMGVPMWPSRAQQIQRTLASFSTDQLKTVLQKVYLADKSLRDARPDDRTVMERFVLSLTE